MACSITSDEFGKTKNGQNITRYTLSNSKGVSVQILDYGGILTTINVPDKNGKIGDVNLGYDSLQEYETPTPSENFFGAIIGRCANRIGGGEFTLDGKTHKLFLNDGPNSHHGGQFGFHKKVFKSSVKDNKLVLVYVSPDGEENYPGELTLTVTYSLTDENALTIDYHATTTQATPVNFTSHAFYNLAGHDCGHINDHVITMPAETYLPLDENNVPTGEVCKVEGTEYDLHKPARFGDRLNNVPGGHGFDINYCLDNKGALVLAARVEHPPSGRFMECHTTEPGMQLYTAFFLKDVTGKGGAPYNQYGAFCLEAQHYPDSVHQPSFPNVILRPGETYTQKTIYTFGVL